MWQLRTFGGLSIEDDGAAMGAPRRRPLALLALLAVAGERGLSREKIVALLWPDSDEEHGRNSLSQALAALRRDTRADDPVMGSAELRLNPGVICSDVGEFERCIASGWDGGALERAVALYQGPFLDGFFVREAADFERWTDEQRRRLHDLCACTLERLARHADERADHEIAVGWWRRFAALEPTSSQAVSGLMRALATTGDRAGAHRQYRVHEELVRQEFGVAPDPAVTALADALLTDRTVLVAAATAPLTDGSALIDSPSNGDGSSVSSPHGVPRVRPRARRGARMLVIAPIVAFATLTGSLILRGRAVGGPPVTSYLNLDVPPGYRLGGYSRAVAISPDGQTLVYGAAPRDSETRLYSRRLDERKPREIPGTVGAHDPFFSPDGQWIGFWTNMGLLKTQLGGGLPQVICQDPRCEQLSSYGASWGRDGRIVLASGPQILGVSANGGLPETLAADSAANTGSLMYLFPEQLPSGRAVLVTAKQFGRTSIVAIPLDSGKAHTVIPSGSHARYLPGYLLYVWDRQLMVVPFDPQRLKRLGPAHVQEDSINDDPRTPPFAVSENGVLAILRDFGSATKLVWKDRRGATTPIPLIPRDYVQPAVSPDGRHIAVTVREGPVRNVWVGSVTGEPLTQLTFSNDDIYTVWTRDSKRVVFTSGRTGHWNLYSVLADGGGEPERLTETAEGEKPTSWSPGGDVLLLNEGAAATKSLDVYEWSIEDRTLRPLLSTRFNESEAAFSPDGRWVAYQSDETGRLQVYVCAYRHDGARQQLSIDGGREPQWNGNGRELFFQTETGAVMSVSLSFDGHDLRSGKPIQLFSFASSGGKANLQAMPDGQRFLVVEQGDVTPRIDVVSGLLNELRRNP